MGLPHIDRDIGTWSRLLSRLAFTQFNEATEYPIPSLIFVFLDELKSLLLAIPVFPADFIAYGLFWIEHSITSL